MNLKSLKQDLEYYGNEEDKQNSLLEYLETLEDRIKKLEEHTEE